MAVTFDTNVLLSATLWNGSVSQKLLFELIRKDVKIYSSPAILSEYQMVLKRDFGFTDEETSDIMHKIMSFVQIIVPKIKVNIVKEDPKDNPIIECALESKSEYIITYDKHLLKISRYKDIKIIKPEEAREII